MPFFSAGGIGQIDMYTGAQVMAEDVPRQRAGAGVGVAHVHDLRLVRAEDGFALGHVR